MNKYQIPWDLMILRALHDGRETELQDIYKNIEEHSFDINPELLKLEPRWGNRPKYQHVVRPAINILLKNGKVERVRRSEYKITEAGKEYLKIREFPTA